MAMFSVRYNNLAIILPVFNILYYQCVSGVVMVRKRFAVIDVLQEGCGKIKFTKLALLEFSYSLLLLYFLRV